jgi:hypothetical protein
MQGEQDLALKPGGLSGGGEEMLHAHISRRKRRISIQRLRSYVLISCTNMSLVQISESTAAREPFELIFSDERALETLQSAEDSSQFQIHERLFSGHPKVKIIASTENLNDESRSNVSDLAVKTSVDCQVWKSQCSIIKPSKIERAK